ncbi:uncharacterized protein LOC110688888 [Chenopodium quinoa]|uniref:uncharacterized protein LOC110688888 n=1 Tax=Chenopodium quinoa TaxID=63459 RepID=UPI000B78269E|nr:uncharacterized protein LOC110688888 [Chenopodium quinoa]
MFTRFKSITNELTCLGKIIPIDEQVRKVLRSLPDNERWRAKVAAVQESKDFTKFDLEQLAGSLITHEIQSNNRTQETVKSQGLALRANEESEEKSDIDEEEAAMLVRRLKKFYRNNKFLDKKKGYSKRNQESKAKSSCHKCGSINHFIKECPLWESKKASTGVPKWVQEAQTKRTEGLGYGHKKKSTGKKKKYVDLPSETVCSFCGKQEHRSEECTKKANQYNKNVNHE